MEILNDTNFWGVVWTVLGAAAVGFGSALRVIKPLIVALLSSSDSKKAKKADTSDTHAADGGTDKDELYERLLEAREAVSLARIQQLEGQLDAAHDHILALETELKIKLLPAPATALVVQEPSAAATTTPEVN